MMTAIYIIVILLQVAVIIYFIRRGRKQRAAQKPSGGDANQNDLRWTSLNVTPAQLKIKIPDSETIVYGVVMDWSMEGSVVTLVCFITGAANMYLSTGGGIQGGGKNPSVGEAASELVTMAQNYVNRAVPTATFDMPPEGYIRFYLLTNHNKLAAQEQIVDIDNGSSPWLGLFEKANEVITEMRAVLN